MVGRFNRPNGRVGRGGVAATLALAAALLVPGLDRGRAGVLAAADVAPEVTPPAWKAAGGDNPDLPGRPTAPPPPATGEPAAATAADAPKTSEPIEVDAEQIVIAYASVPNTQATRTRPEAQQFAQQLAAELVKSPDQFAAYVQKFSDGAKAEDGSVGPFRRGRMTPAFEQAVYALPIGGITVAPVETPYGFHIIKRIAVPAVYSARFILISWDSAGKACGIMALRTEDDAAKNAAKVWTELQAHPEKFREDQMFFSDDPHKNRGGVLPDFYPGRADPALIAAVEKLAAGSIAPPFKTKYGYMIVQRLELLRNRPPLTGFASALHLVVSYAGADGTLPPGTPLPAGAGEGDAASQIGGNVLAIESRNWGQARDRARELAEKARKNPALFAAMIKTDSDALDAKAGGDLGFVDLSHVPSDLRDWGQTLENLKIGEVGEPVESGAGFDILVRKPLPLRLHARQILIAWAGRLPNVVRDQAAAARQAAQYLAELKAVPPAQLEKTFAEYANKYSDDNANKGGDLGTFAPQSYFHEVTDALLNLPIGKMSDLVTTPYGYAILLRLEPNNPLPEEKNATHLTAPPVTLDPHQH